MQIHQIIIPLLSFKSGAEEAASFYVSIFPDSKIVKTINNPATGTAIQHRRTHEQPGPAKAARVMQALLQMTVFDCAAFLRRSVRATFLAIWILIHLGRLESTRN